MPRDQPQRPPMGSSLSWHSQNHRWERDDADPSAGLCWPQVGGPIRVRVRVREGGVTSYDFALHFL